MVRAQTKDGAELVKLHLDIIRGILTVTRYTAEGAPYEAVASIKDRLEAAHWLADRGFGKVTEQVSLSGPDGHDLIGGGLLEAAALLAKELASKP